MEEASFIIDRRRFVVFSLYAGIGHFVWLYQLPGKNVPCAWLDPVLIVEVVEMGLYSIVLKRIQ
jgi:hypothetical protein